MRSLVTFLSEKNLIGSRKEVLKQIDVYKRATTNNFKDLSFFKQGAAEIKPEPQDDMELDTPKKSKSSKPSKSQKTPETPKTPAPKSPKTPKALPILHKKRSSSGQEQKEDPKGKKPETTPKKKKKSLPSN